MLGLCDDADPSSDRRRRRTTAAPWVNELHSCAGESDDTRLRLIMEREPAAEDTASSTAQTVRKMCEYIRESVRSGHSIGRGVCLQIVLRAAGAIHSLWAWAAFWFVKHRVKRVLDEGALIRLGEPDQVDMFDFAGGPHQNARCCRGTALAHRADQPSATCPVAGGRAVHRYGGLRSAR